MNLAEQYARSDDEGRLLLADPHRLRRAASWVCDRLPGGRVVLLARTDAALAVCAAVAVQRCDATEVQRAYVGRTGWEAPAAGILIEPAPLSPGLAETLSTALSVQTLELPRWALTEVPLAA